MEAPLAPRTSSACEHSMIVKEMNQVHELMSQLRAIVLPSPDPAACSPELVRGLFEDIFGSFTIVLSKLQACSHFQDADPDECDGYRKRFLANFENISDF